MSESDDLIVGRYRLAAQIGAGGMGVVWRARDELLGRTVALKELNVPAHLVQGAGDDGARRAMREARIAARLHHPNVIGIYDVVNDGGRPFLVMEYLASRSLSQLISDGELLTPQRAAGIGAQLANGLNAAHEAGVVHRDVKPGNVLLGEDGSVKLTDFGISRAVDDTSVTASGILLGTLGYMAPEAAQGESADARTDVYALGATLYAAVEGHAPFGNSDNAVALLYRIVHEDIIPMQRSGPLEPVLLRMLDRDPALRLTMPQVQRALEAIEHASTTPAAEAVAVPVPVTLPLQADAPPTPTPTPTPAAPAASAASAAIEDAHAADSPPQTPESAQPPSSQPPQPPSPEQQRRRRRALIGALIAVPVLALGGWAIAALPNYSQTPPTAASSTHTNRAAAGKPSPSSPASTATTPSPASSHPATTASTAASSAPPSSPTPTSAPSQSVTAQLVSTIVDYYKLMPGNLDQGWTWMTADYQQNHAGGRSGYDSFWSQIQRVTDSNVTASAPSTVVATIDYYYKDGSAIEERTKFGMVHQQGRWLIASSSVLSHRNL